MITGIVILLVVGILLSAFFSGSETGFYRVTRVRLVLDARGGSLIARWLLWLTNNPSMFVATTLVGNNLANYLTSIAIVLLAGAYFGENTYVVEIVAPILFSPLVFVYGELMPKHLFFQAPNKLLRLGGVLFVWFTLLFLPLSMILWVLGRGLQWLVGESPERVQLRLARKELQQVFDEGHEAGILEPSQRSLAQSLFAIAGDPVSKFLTPINRCPTVRISSKKAAALRLAGRHRLPAIAVLEEDSQDVAGYVRVIDLYLDDSEDLPLPRRLIEVHETDAHSVALIQMQSEKELLARVVNMKGQTVGLLRSSQLTEPLFRDV